MKFSPRFHALRTGQAGLGLVELMIAMLLGILVAGSAVAIFSTNRQAYAATESLGRIQENARVAYELMGRDIRMAFGTPCAARNLPMANLTTGPSGVGQWWQTWGGGISGYNQGSTPPPGAPANMTTAGDALVLIGSDDSPMSVVSHDPANRKFVLNAAPAAFKANDLVVVCDYRQGGMFQINSATTGGPYTMTYAKGGMNCGQDMSLPVNCGSAKPGVKFANNAMIGRVRSVVWYIANNGRGGTSLYQAQLDTGGVIDTQEIADGVTAMSLSYLVNGATAYCPAQPVGGGCSVGGNWTNVVAVRVALTLQGQDNGQGQGRISTAGGALARNFVQVISVRNHLQ
ncbi:MAG: PilW family protein [Proteobacteria bacterium]|nr:PilW family protein [Pseudomonadota bacterium]